MDDEMLEAIVNISELIDSLWDVLEGESPVHATGALGTALALTILNGCATKARAIQTSQQVHAQILAAAQAH